MGNRTVLQPGAGALAEYYDWLQESQDGDTLVYWIGDLQYDRQVTVSPDDIYADQKKMIVSTANIIADRLMADYRAGMLHLLQARLAPYETEYRAIRRRAPAGGGVRLEQVNGPDAELVLA